MHDVTLSQMYRDYEVFKQVKDKTKAKARKAFAHLVAFSGDVPARNIGPGRVNKWQSWLAKTAPNARTGRAGLSAVTVKTTVGAAAAVFGWALRQREPDGSCEYGLTANPFCDAEAVKVDHRQVRYYSEDEARDILAAASELRWRDETKTLAWYAAIHLAAGSGLRKGEVLNLRRIDVDLDRGRVLIRHRDDAPGRWWAWISKGRHEGEVPLSDGGWAAMARLLEVRPWMYPFLQHRRMIDLMGRPWPLPEDLRDTPANNWTREFNRILKRANRNRQLAGKDVLCDGDFHQLRRSTGTWLAERGVPEHYVQATLRHASPETTRKHYVGLNHRQCEQAVRDAINTINL